MKRPTKKQRIQNWIKKISKNNPNVIYCLDFNRAADRVNCICTIHGGKFTQRLDHLGNGRLGCEKCNFEKRGNTRSGKTNQGIPYSQIIGTDLLAKFKITLPENTKRETELVGVCTEHGKFQTKVEYLINNNYGCPECGERIGRSKGKHRTINSLEDTLISAFSEAFHEKCRETHEGYYEYDDELKPIKQHNGQTSLKVSCPSHGDFLVNAYAHAKGRKCLKCSYELRGQNARTPKINWLRRFKQKHGSSYDYSQIPQSFGIDEPLPILCNEHGIFFQTAYKHGNLARGCRKCATIKNTSNFLLSTAEWKARLSKLPKWISYDLPKKHKARDEINCKCKKHGDFKKPLYVLANGNHCPICAKLDSTKKMQLTKLGIKTLSIHSTVELEKFWRKRLLHRHGTRYEYILPTPLGADSVIEIICKRHGQFEQTLGNHYYRQSGCPRCKMTKGERNIAQYLEMKNINYVFDNKFEDLKVKRKLKFDFYLPDLNKLVEYDGVQHFEPVGFFGGEKGLKKTKAYDQKKNKYAKAKGIPLLRIKYDEPIEEKLAEFV